MKRVSAEWYQGTADAVYQNIYSIGSEQLWLGPPSMVKKMQAFAFAGICCGLGDNTPARAWSEWSRAESATDPIP